MKKSYEYEKITDIEYGELSPEVVINPNPEITTIENRERLDLASIENMKALHEDMPIHMDINDLHISKEGYNIPIRIYKPEGKGMLPVAIYYHGGGWVKGNIETHDYVCRYIAKGSSSIVVSVGYRLAPEYKFSTGLEDCYDALVWVEKNAGTFNGDPSRIAVVGDSAGGNLATVVCLLARERQEPHIQKQVLIYPSVDVSDTSHGSYKRYEKGYNLERQHVEACIKHYINNESERTNPYVSPLLAEDVSGLPSALIILGECDVLVDEGLKYAKKLKDAGINVEYHVYKGMPHGFIQYNYKETFNALDIINSVLKFTWSNYANVGFEF
jgi:acetyl esterase